MKTGLALALGLAALAGCTRHVIVDRPAPAQSTVVVPTPSPSAGGTAATVITPAPAAACTYASQSYSHGSLTCQDRAEFRCNSGNWERTASPAC